MIFSSHYSNKVPIKMVKYVSVPQWLIWPHGKEAFSWKPFLPQALGTLLFLHHRLAEIPSPPPYDVVILLKRDISGFCDYGFSGKSGYSDCNPVDEPPSLHNSDSGYNDPQFRPLCSEIATVDTFGGRCTQRNIVWIGLAPGRLTKRKST